MTARVWPIISHVKSSRSFGASVLILAALLFSSQMALAQSVFTQQGPKLVGTGVVGAFAGQGWSVALSADGNTALVGGPSDNDFGAVWVYTRSGGVWTQQGGKLVAKDAVGPSNPNQGWSVALSADGNTAMVSGPADGLNAGAAWVYTRSANVWTQQGGKLIGTGAVGNAFQGGAVALSGDGNTAIVGGFADNYSNGSNAGAAWVYNRSSGVWTQQGGKLIGTGAAGAAEQGYSVSLSGDGNIAIVGGPADNPAGAAWVFVKRTKADCQKGGWLNFIGPPGPFTSQSQCVNYFAQQK